MLDIIITAVIVAAALVYIIRRLVKGGCDCGCDKCGLRDKCKKSLRE
jgi:hypothetical protein